MTGLFIVLLLFLSLRFDLNLCAAKIMNGLVKNKALSNCSMENVTEIAVDQGQLNRNFTKQSKIVQRIANVRFVFFMSG